MKNVCTLLVACCVFLVSCNSSKSLVSTNFDTKSEYHRKVAVIPFNVEFSQAFVSKDRLSTRDLNAIEDDYSVIFQEKTESYLSYKLRDIEVQGIQKTNNILKKSLEGRNIEEVDMDELAGLLNVDAIIYGHVKLDKPMENDVAILVSTAKSMERILLGTSYGRYVRTVTNSAQGDFYLYDGESGSKLWTGQNKVECGVNSTMDDVANIMVERAIKRIPYRG